MVRIPLGTSAGIATSTLSEAALRRAYSGGAGVSFDGSRLSSARLGRLGFVRLKYFKRSRRFSSSASCTISSRTSSFKFSRITSACASRFLTASRTLASNEFPMASMMLALNEFLMASMGLASIGFLGSRSSSLFNRTVTPPVRPALCEPGGPTQTPGGESALFRIMLIPLRLKYGMYVVSCRL